MRIILALLHVSYGYSRDVLRGVRSYSQKKNWSIHFTSPGESSPGRSIRNLRPHGIIAHVANEMIDQELKDAGLPCVNVSGMLPRCSHPSVLLDDYQIGRMAGEYFIESGFRHFAFCGYGSQDLSTTRYHGYRDAVRAAMANAVLSDDGSIDQTPNPGRSPAQRNAATLAWLRKLPKPLAVFACNDNRALQVATVCRLHRLRVPEDVAILGVDDDDLVCDLANPRLSSVAIPGEQVGIHAARLLDRLMKGQTPPKRVQRLRPLGVVPRPSTALVAVDDAVVAKSVRFIRANSAKPISVSDVTEHSSVSRRQLERRFAATLKRGILDEIHRARLTRAQEMLWQTDLPLGEVAKRCGCRNQHGLIALFRVHLKMTPGAYRARLRR